jgi:hypothetical protein
VAQELIIELCNQGGNTTFGEVMKRVRASMLRNGNVMSLALACFGDIDWKFE